LVKKRKKKERRKAFNFRQDTSISGLEEKEKKIKVLGLDRAVGVRVVVILNWQRGGRKTKEGKKIPHSIHFEFRRQVTRGPARGKKRSWGGKRRFDTGGISQKKNGRKERVVRRLNLEEGTNRSS